MKLQSVMFNQANNINFSATKKVLYAEDDRNLQKSFSRLIDSSAPDGDTVELSTADSLDGALKLLKEKFFDGVITDGSIPFDQTDGQKIIELALEKGISPRNIVLVSGGEDNRTTSAITKGVQFISKGDGDAIGKIQTFVRNLFNT